MRPAGSTRPPRLRSAYTLLEMLIVVAILAIAAALLVPNLVRRDTFTIETVLRKLVADLTFAQSDALADQGYRRVHFDRVEIEPGVFVGTGWGVYEIGEGQIGVEIDPEVATAVRDPLAGGGQAMRLSLLDDTRYRGVSIRAIDIDSGRNWLTFDPLGGTIGSGGVPGTGGSLEVRSDSLTYRVSIDAFTGKVSVARVDP
jgi:prepilin-type N-terminal cleavage/methylation domain-containing protein